MAVVAITGAGRGIGRALAVGLADSGADVALFGRTAADLAPVAEQVRAAGRQAATAVVDVRDAAAVGAALSAAETELGPLTGFVNNAGVQRLSPAMDVTAADWDEVIGTNLTGAFRCMQAAAGLMRGRGGSIVNIASVAGMIAVPGRAAYAASKAGLLMLTRVCAVEWAAERIRVNAVSPTFVDTELGRQTLDRPGERDRIVGGIPMGRLASTDDVLGAVRFLLDEKAAGFVTGEVIAVDGGLRA